MIIFRYLSWLQGYQQNLRITNIKKSTNDKANDNFSPKMTYKQILLGSTCVTNNLKKIKKIVFIKKFLLGQQKYLLICVTFYFFFSIPV